MAKIKNFIIELKLKIPVRQLARLAFASTMDLRLNVSKIFIFDNNK